MRRKSQSLRIVFSKIYRTNRELYLFVKLTGNFNLLFVDVLRFLGKILEVLGLRFLCRFKISNYVFISGEFRQNIPSKIAKIPVYVTSIWVSKYMQVFSYWKEDEYKHTIPNISYLLSCTKVEIYYELQ